VTLTDNNVTSVLYDWLTIILANVPVEPTVSPEELYTELTTNLKNSVDNGNFTTILRSIARQYNATNLYVASAYNTASSALIVENEPTSAPTTVPHSNASNGDVELQAGAVVGIVFGLLFFVLLVKLMYDWFTFNNKQWSKLNFFEYIHNRKQKNLSTTASLLMNNEASFATNTRNSNNFNNKNTKNPMYSNNAVRQTSEENLI
jgi:hypothetical protein